MRTDAGAVVLHAQRLELVQIVQSAGTSPLLEFLDLSHEMLVERQPQRHMPPGAWEG